MATNGSFSSFCSTPTLFIAVTEYILISVRETTRRLVKRAVFILLPFIALSCKQGSKTEKEESPTAGDLKVYYDEGLKPQVLNQEYTFEALYPNVNLSCTRSTESEAIQALYNDSCESIFTSRLLNKAESDAFAGKGYFPKFSKVAYDGVALIVSAESKVPDLSADEVKQMMLNGTVKDSAGADTKCTVLFDRDNSSALHYMFDSVLNGGKCTACASAESTLDCIEKVANGRNIVGVIDFAWLSDVDDEVYKRYAARIRILRIGRDGRYETPSQSSFKTQTYPFTRAVYLMRKTGDFTLAKGFESFVAGPKGQLMFLKQGLLPARQAERTITVNIGEEDEK
jgi:phosphate transport system substrate-binding protein